MKARWTSAGRDPAPEVVELVERAMLEQLVHLAGDRPPHVGYAEQAVIIQRIDVGGVPVHRSSRLLVRPGLVGLATRDGDQIGVLLKPRHGHFARDSESVRRFRERSRLGTVARIDQTLRRFLIAFLPKYRQIALG